MEGHIHQNSLQLTSFAFDGNANLVTHLAKNHPYQQYIMEAEGDGIHYIPPPLPQWIECQQKTHNYVEFLAASGVSEMQGEISCNKSGMASNSKVCDIDAQKVRYLRPHNAEAPVNFTSAEHEIHVQKQESNGGHHHASQPCSEVPISTSVFPPKLLNNRSRQRSSTDRSRRMKIQQRLDALHELLPHSKEGSKADLLDDINNHVKFLQLQIKELSQNRLGGESTPSPFIFFEGYGHYLLHEHMLNVPLEEMLGKLLEEDPSAAIQLLESRGLFIMPMATQGLH